MDEKKNPYDFCDRYKKVSLRLKEIEKEMCNYDLDCDEIRFCHGCNTYGICYTSDWSDYWCDNCGKREIHVLYTRKCYEYLLRKRQDQS